MVNWEVAAAYARRHKHKTRNAVLYGTGSGVIAPGKTGTIQIKLTAAAQAQLRSHKSLRARSILVARDGAGHKVTKTANVTLRRAKATHRKKH